MASYIGSVGVLDSTCRRLRLRTRKSPSTTSAMTATPPIDAPMAAFAPVERPELEDDLFDEEPGLLVGDEDAKVDVEITAPSSL